MRNDFCKLLSMAMLTAGFSAAGQAQTITTEIDFANSATSIAVNPVTNKIYAISPTISGTKDSLAVIDGTTDTLTKNVAVPLGASATTVNYLTNNVYVAGCDYSQSPSPCTVTIISGKTNAIVGKIPVTMTPGLGLTGIVVNPVTGFVYVANANDNVVDIICLAQRKVTGTIALNGNSPSAIAINPLLNRLYVPLDNNLTDVIDAGKKKVLSTTNYGSITVGAAVDLLTGNVFVTDQETELNPQGSPMTGVFDQNGKVVASITVDDLPMGVDVDPFTDLAFVAGNALDELIVIDGSTNTVKNVVSNVPATYVAVNVVTEKVYVAGRNGVTVLTEK